jgi:hypothetical protein
MSECKLFDNKKFAETNKERTKKLSAKMSCRKKSLQNFYCKTRQGLNLQKRNGGTKFAAIFLFLYLLKFKIGVLLQSNEPV